MSPTANWAVTALLAFVSGTGGWATLQWILNRRGRTADAAAREADREKTLADAQAIAQKTALDSANLAYQSVRQQCDDCRLELIEHRKATEKLVDAVEALIEQNGVAERQQARLAIREYRAL